MPISDWEYYGHLQHYAKMRGEFCVRLMPLERRKELSKRERIEIADRVLEPLRRRSSAVFLYKPNFSAPCFQGLSAPYAKKNGKVLLGNAHMSAFLPLLVDPWSFEKGVRGTLLFELEEPADVWSEIFPYCYDPVIITNIISSCTASAVHYARRKRKEGKTFVLLCEQNSGMEDLLIISPADVLPEVLSVAARSCMAGKALVASYGPGAKLAPLEDHVTYGTGFPE